MSVVPVVSKNPSWRPRRALVSVSDKTGIVEFAAALQALDIDILSTGGTRRAIAEAGIAVTEVAAVTGFPEIMDGRVKTLHPKIHGGILARRHLDAATLVKHDIGTIDLVAVNLYPFEQTVARPGCTLDLAIENIDIGGPAMLRSAAKNHRDVLVVANPQDYDEVAERLRANRADSGFRLRMAGKAFAHTAAYDAAITRYLETQT